MEQIIEAEWIATNESLDAIINGMNLNSKDIVLSICGSGDIPFAIAPLVKKVIAVDGSLNQINYARARKEALLE